MFGTHSKLAFFLVAHKILLFSLVLISLQIFPVFSEPDFKVSTHFPQSRGSEPEDRFKAWDAQLYLEIATNGFEDQAKNSLLNAFYPGWPYTIKGLIILLGLTSTTSKVIISLLLANIFSILGTMIFFSLVKGKWGTEPAIWSTLVLISYPGNFFMSVPYSESMFFFLSVLFFKFLLEANYKWAGVVGFFLPLTRAVGLFSVLPFLVQIFVQKKSKANNGSNAQRTINGKFAIFPWLYALIPVLGIACYFLLIQLATGNWLEGFHAQSRYIGQASILKVLNPWPFLTALLSKWDVHPYVNSSLDKIAFLLLLPLVIQVRKLEKSLFVWALLLCLVPAMSLSFMSFIRFGAVIFPAFIVLGKLLTNSGWETRALVLAAGITFQVLFLLMYVNNFWVG